MALPTTQEQLKTLIQTASTAKVNKSNATATGNVPRDLWTQVGVPIAGTHPTTTTGEAYDYDSTGAIQFKRPASGDVALVGVKPFMQNFAQGLYIVDRLVANGGIDATTTSLQTFNTTALPARAGSGDGCEMWVVSTTAQAGATAGTITVGYTNSSGVSGRVTQPLPWIGGTLRIHTIDRLSLQDGDTGVQSVQSFQATNATTSGTFGILICRRIASIPGKFVSYEETYGPIFLGLPTFSKDACLQLIATVPSSSAPVVNADILTASV